MINIDRAVVVEGFGLGGGGIGGGGEGLPAQLLGRAPSAAVGLGTAGGLLARLHLPRVASAAFGLGHSNSCRLFHPSDHRGGLFDQPGTLANLDGCLPDLFSGLAHGIGLSLRGGGVGGGLAGIVIGFGRGGSNSLSCGLQRILVGFVFHD